MSSWQTMWCFIVVENKEFGLLVNILRFKIPCYDASMYKLNKTQSGWQAGGIFSVGSLASDSRGNVESPSFCLKKYCAHISYQNSLSKVKIKGRAFVLLKDRRHFYFLLNKEENMDRLAVQHLLLLTLQVKINSTLFSANR